MSVELNFPGLVDIRNPIAGDSFNWAGTEPTAAKKWLVFHHSASDAPAEDGFSIAEYHVNNNGWGGIGYHFVITRSDYPGRAGYTNPGAQVQYVGDLLSWRAHVANQNPGRVGICLVGMTPDEGQLKLARQLVDYFIAPNEILPSINYYNQVTVHRLVPDQQTSCPGDDYGSWLPYLQGGAEPASFSTPPAVVPDPAPVVGGMGNGQPQAPVVPVTVIPEYESSWTPLVDVRTVEQSGAFAVDATTGAHLTDIAVGTIVQIAGYFTLDGTRYARSQWAAANNKWNGIDATFFDTPGQTNAPVIPVTVSDAVASDVTDAQLKEALSPTTQKVTLIDLLKEIGAWFVALFIKGKK